MPAFPVQQSSVLRRPIRSLRMSSRYILVALVLILAPVILAAESADAANDKRPRLAIVMAEDEYKTSETLPAFAHKFLEKDFRVQLIFGNDKNRNDIPELTALDQS